MKSVTKVLSCFLPESAQRGIKVFNAMVRDKNFLLEHNWMEQKQATLETPRQHRQCVDLDELSSDRVFLGGRLEDDQVLLLQRNDYPRQHTLEKVSANSADSI